MESGGDFRFLGRMGAIGRDPVAWAKEFANVFADGTDVYVCIVFRVVIGMRAVRYNANKTNLPLSSYPRPANGGPFNCA